MDEKTSVRKRVASRGIAIALSLAAMTASIGAQGSMPTAPGPNPAAQGSDRAAQPALPDHERLVYSRTVGRSVDTLEIDCRLVSGKDGAWYEVVSSAPDQDSTYRLDARTLFANYMDITSRGPDATIRRVTSVLENKAKTGSDEVLVSSFEALPYTLRAFPWGARQKAKLVFLGAGRGADFRFDLSVTGKESLSVGSSNVQCWKAQLSMGGVLGAFMGKSVFWFAADYPHYMVRAESSSAGPGSPPSVLSLVSYSSGS
jgi:hypothetical protein